MMLPGCLESSMGVSFGEDIFGDDILTEPPEPCCSHCLGPTGEVAVHSGAVGSLSFLSAVLWYPRQLEEGQCGHNYDEKGSGVYFSCCW